jgi:hypothetical protein
MGLSNQLNRLLRRLGNGEPIVVFFEKKMVQTKYFLVLGVSIMSKIDRIKQLRIDNARCTTLVNCNTIHITGSSKVLILAYELIKFKILFRYFDPLLLVNIKYKLYVYFVGELFDFENVMISLEVIPKLTYLARHFFSHFVCLRV